MFIRRAEDRDIPALTRLLFQVQQVHHLGRPDLFKAAARKYTDDELSAIIHDDTRPIFVADTGDGTVLGYCFCIYQQHINNNNLTDIRTLYIDDLYVDETSRGQHVGRTLYEYVVDFARRDGFYNLTLNVWSLNESAMKFYQACGLVPQKVGMEKIL